MKRLMGCAVIGFMLLATASLAAAAPVTQPLDPKDGARIEVDVEYDRVLARELVTGGGATDNDVEHFQAVYAKAQYAIHSLLNPYVRLGTAQLERKMEDLFLEHIGQRDLTFASEWGFAYGFGLSGAYTLPWWGIKVGYDTRYTRTESDVDSVKHEDNVLAISPATSNISGTMNWEETQATIWLGRSFPLSRVGVSAWTADPYVGATWSHLNMGLDDADYTVTDGGASRNLHVTQSATNARHYSGVVGFGLVWNKRAVIRAEGRLGDEIGVAGSVGYRF